MRFQKKKAPLRESLVTALEVPRDLGCRETILTLTGKSQAVIENYRCILKFTEEEIVIRTFTGKLTIIGRRLEISWYTPDEMRIKGCISRVIPE